VVDDEPAARYALTRAFSGNHRVLEAGSVAEAREKLREFVPDVILLDYSMPDGDGLTLLKEIGGGDDGPAVIMLTAHGSERLAVEAMKAGAYDYLAKPYDLEELRLAVERALERQDLRREVQGLRERLAGEGEFGSMAGASAAMVQLFETAERVARSDLPVLILGESGTGKDLLAREIHARSGRARKPFVALNCAALPETLVESELFGSEKGAFTGATATRAGKFESAHGGTLFLDEIGDMDPAMQAKILRASESGVIERLGGSRAIPIDVRLISATNKDALAEVRSGRFREDLYYRLAGVTLYIPPLRERPDDIPLLIDRFWSQLRRKHGRPGPVLTPEAIERLERSPWPGNVRQLRSAVERLFVLAAGDQVTPADVELAIGPGQGADTAGELQGALTASTIREARQLFEAQYLSRKLHEHGGNVTRTASAIGLERQSLQEKMKKLGVLRTPK
jgi:DNA-binding NtrC family response regulator